MAATDGRVLRELGDGLVLRRSAAADSDRLAEFNGRIHGNHETGEPERGVAAWARDLLERPHPTFAPGDFTLVEDSRTGAVVSVVNLISQRWSYGGIEFGVGRPEMVGTDPQYRGRGLVRAQFEVIHGWSAERGEMLQAITGIPYFYRQFGYEMCLALGGARTGFRTQLPEPKGGEPEPYAIRPAAEADLPFLAGVYRRAARRWLVASVRGDAEWRYILGGRSAESLQSEALRVVETAEGQPVGLLVHPGRLWGTVMAATLYELGPGVSFAAVTPTVLRYLWATGQERAADDPKSRCDGYQLALGPDHPAYQAAGGYLPQQHAPYAWYVRVPDLPAFVRHIAPVLEARLAESPLAGHTGSVTLGFYRSGLRLNLERGRLAACEPWTPTPHDGGSALFPNLTFLQLLFGYRSFGELRYAWPDCGGFPNHSWPLLDALFPRQNSTVWALA